MYLLGLEYDMAYGQRTIGSKYEPLSALALFSLAEVGSKYGLLMVGEKACQDIWRSMVLTTWF